MQSLGASVPLSHPSSSGAHREFQPRQVCPHGIYLSLPFPFLPLGLVFLLPFIFLLAFPPPLLSHAHILLSILIFLSVFFFLIVYFYLLPFLFGFLEFFMSDSLPAIRGRNSLFPWWIRKNAVHPSLLPSPYLGSARWLPTTSCLSSAGRSMSSGG